MSGKRCADELRRVQRNLSERDMAVLRDVQRVRLLHSGQIERLHFWDGSGRAKARRCRRVLRRLTDIGMLKRLERRIGGMHAGSAGYIYALDTLGQRLQQSSGPAGGQRRRRPWEPSPQFQDHILAVSELYVDLREQERQTAGVTLVEYQSEPSCWRTFVTLGEQRTLKPDAYAHVYDGDFEQHSFIEIDRGTEHAPTLRRKLAVYIDAFDAGITNDDDDPFPNVVWVVPDQRRVDQLTTLITALPSEHQPLFSVAVMGTELPIIQGGIPQ